MRLQDMYEAAYRAGMAADPRGEEGVGRILAQARKDYDELPEAKRWEFDQERLVNPYADTRILYGDPKTEVSSILVGIDLEVGEVLLADRLREKGQPRRPDVCSPSRGPGARAARRGDGGAGRRVAPVRSVDRLRRRGHERPHGRDHAGPPSPQQRAHGAGGAPPRHPLHVLPHPGRQQRQRVRAGAVRRDWAPTGRWTNCSTCSRPSRNTGRRSSRGPARPSSRASGRRRTGKIMVDMTGRHVRPGGFPRQTGGSRRRHHRRHAHGRGPSQAGQRREDHGGHRRPRVVRFAGHEPHHRPVRAPGRPGDSLLGLHPSEPGLITRFKMKPRSPKASLTAELHFETSSRSAPGRSAACVWSTPLCRRSTAAAPSASRGGWSGRAGADLVEDLLLGPLALQLMGHRRFTHAGARQERPLAPGGPAGLRGVGWPPLSSP